MLLNILNIIIMNFSSTLIQILFFCNPNDEFEVKNIVPFNCLNAIGLDTVPKKAKNQIINYVLSQLIELVYFSLSHRLFFLILKTR